MPMHCRIILLVAALRLLEVEGFATLPTQWIPKNHNGILTTTTTRNTKPSPLSMITPPSLSHAGSHPRKPVAFKHLFRHYDDISMDCWLRCEEPAAFLLSCGYTQDEIDAMATEYPAILDKDVHDHLAPHLRFLVRTLGGGTGDLLWASEENADAALVDHTEECAVCSGTEDERERHRLRVSELAKKVVPVKNFFNLRLEKTLAPWHAYMTWQKGLPSGAMLLEQDNGAKLREFLDVCQSGKLDRFVDLCNAWDVTDKHHTAEMISEFTYSFQEGLVPAVRNHLHVDPRRMNCRPGEMVELLLSHGANHLEDDHHGASLLHWAAGTGNMRAVISLLRAGEEEGTPVQDIIALDQVAKDGATVLHWAACGVTPQGFFGSGGHAEICRLLLDLAGKDFANQNTYSQNSPLEWAAWAGSHDVVKLLIEEYDVDPHYCSDSGSVAHWACAGGSLRVCQYLADTCGVNFCVPNRAKGWSPLNIASSEYHPHIAEWLVQRCYQTTCDDRGYDKARQEIQNEVSKAMQEEFLQKQDEGKSVPRQLRA